MTNRCLSDMEIFGGQSASLGLYRNFGEDLPEFSYRAMQVPDCAGK